MDQLRPRGTSKTWRERMSWWPSAKDQQIRIKVAVDDMSNWA